MYLGIVVLPALFSIGPVRGRSFLSCTTSRLHKFLVFASAVCLHFTSLVRRYRHVNMATPFHLKLFLVRQRAYVRNVVVGVTTVVEKRIAILAHRPRPMLIHMGWCHKAQGAAPPALMIARK